MPSIHGLKEVRATTDPDFHARYPEAHCFVYEVWDSMHRLAYVGIADNFERRWQQHRRSSWWLGEIDIWYIDIFGYRSRWEARQMEACVINEQSPIYNTSLESAAYREYRALWEDPERPIDDLDCVPVKRRRFAGASYAVV